MSTETQRAEFEALRMTPTRTPTQLLADAALYERFGLHASAQALRERALGMRALGGGGQFGGGTTTRQTAEVRPP